MFSTLVKKWYKKLIPYARHYIFVYFFSHFSRQFIMQGRESFMILFSPKSVLFFANLGHFSFIDSTLFSYQTSWGLYYRAVCTAKNFSETQDPRFISKRELWWCAYGILYSVDILNSIGISCHSHFVTQNGPFLVLLCNNVKTVQEILYIGIPKVVITKRKL